MAGAAGGVIYSRAFPRAEKRIAALEELSRRLSRPGRLLPGDFLYTTDITCDSVRVRRSWARFWPAAYYDERIPNFVLTMETKGIPVAMMTAKMLNVTAGDRPPRFQGV